jgi:PAS domain S-box-containing protein
MSMNEQELLKKTQEENEVLRNRNEELEDFIENGSIPLHWVDGNGIIIWANKAELDALGYTKEEYIGRPIKDFHEDEPVINDILARLGNKETLRNYEARLKCKDGSLRHVLINSNVLWKDDKFVHTRCFTRDITALKEAERKKDEFIGAASHELKTPLTSLKAYIQLMESTLKEGDISKAAIYLHKTTGYVDRLNKLIEELLDISRIQGGKLQLNITKFDLDELINEAIDAVQNIVDHKITKRGGVTRLVSADRQRIEQVLVNLLTNAAKYSPKGEKIDVAVKEDQNSVTISIRDFGIGIPSEKQGKIFERFYRAEEDQVKFQGLGLGLYISSEIINSHKGKIWVESEEGKGSTFYVMLPAQ